MLRRYWSSVCPKCPLKAQCTPTSNRRITRWELKRCLRQYNAASSNHPSP